MDEYIRVMGIYSEVDGNSIYIAMRSNGGDSYLIRLISPSIVDILDDQGASGQSLSDSSMSADRRSIALISTTYSEEGRIRIFDLENEQSGLEIKIEQGPICGHHWLNDTTLIYSVVVTRYCGSPIVGSRTVELYNIETDTITRLSPNTDNPSWLVRR